MQGLYITPEARADLEYVYKSIIPPSHEISGSDNEQSLPSKYLRRLYVYACMVFRSVQYGLIIVRHSVNLKCILMIKLLQKYIRFDYGFEL